MPFFARPNLDDIQFKQLTGTTLTLSGTTRIAEIGGLEFIDEYGTCIPVVITGATPQDVLTYEGGKLILRQPTSGTSTGVYDGLSPAIVEVGGIDVGYTLTGKTITCILQDMLVPTIEPTTVSSPYSIFCISPAVSSILEVGCQVTLTGSINTFNRGVVNPAYGCPTIADGYRVGAATCYEFSSIWTGTVCCTTGSPSISFGTNTIGQGNNSMSGLVWYSQGCCVYKSDCITPSSLYSQCAAGCTNGTCPSGVISRNITGIYPWFYGSSISVPVIGDSLIAAATCKCVQQSTGDIVATNYNVTGEYIWFAIPCASSSMLKWQGSNSPSNCGTIPGDLFASEVLCSVNSPSSCWVSQCYRFYVSNYPTSINYCMTFKRS